MTDKKLNVAVVGAGIYGINHIRAYLENEHAQLVAVCDQKQEIREKIENEFGLKTYSDIEDLLENESLDAISIATPDAFHLEPTLAAIRKGLDVLVEKPLATTVEDAKTIVETAKEYNVRVAVDYHKRWDPAAINVRNELGKKDAGKIIRGYMSMDDIIDVPTKWFNWADKSSPVHFLGTHCFDQIRWYTGCEVKSVYALGTKRLLKSKGIDTYDSIQTFMEMDDGTYWTVENSWVLPSGFPKNNGGRTEILCDNMMFRLDSQNRGSEIYGSDKGKTPNSYFIIENNGKASGFGIQPINDFVYCILNDVPFIADANDGLQAELIADAVHKSLMSGERVVISENS